MRSRRHKRLLTPLAAATAAGLLLAACAPDEAADDDGTDTGSPLAGEEITIAVFSGWEEGIVASYLWGHILTEEGAEVTYITSDPGPTFEGVAAGDADISFDAWLPNTHEDHWATHGENLEDLGAWYDEAPLTVAVTEDSPAQSLADLAEHAEAYGNRIVGIEAGSGLNRIIEEEVIPTYGLEEMEFIPSSTDAMLTELETATDVGDHIVVGLWQPHWAYAAFPIRNLEDPEGVLADAEEIHAFARLGFGEDYPELAGWVENFTLTEEQLLELERIMFIENDATTEEEYLASVEQWLSANPDWVETVQAG